LKKSKWYDSEEFQHIKELMLRKAQLFSPKPEGSFSTHNKYFTVELPLVKSGYKVALTDENVLHENATSPKICVDTYGPGGSLDICSTSSLKTAFLTDYKEIVKHIEYIFDRLIEKHQPDPNRLALMYHDGTEGDM